MVCIHMFIFCIISTWVLLSFFFFNNFFFPIKLPTIFFTELEQIISWSNRQRVLISHVFSSLFSYLLPQFQISDSLFWFIPVYSLLVVFSVFAFFPPNLSSVLQPETFLCSLVPITWLLWFKAFDCSSFPHMVNPVAVFVTTQSCWLFGTQWTAAC